jgi:hypothetical protein
MARVTENRKLMKELLCVRPRSVRDDWSWNALLLGDAVVKMKIETAATSVSD